MFYQNPKFILIYSVFMIFVLVAMLYFVISITDHEIGSLTLESITSPFFGENQIIVMLFNLFLIFDVFWLTTSLIPNAISRPEQQPLVLTLPEMFPLVGFVIGFIEYNFWFMLPYAAAGLVLLYYSYSQLSSKTA